MVWEGSFLINYKVFLIQGETKGKEVDLNALVRHNPLIFHTKSDQKETATTNGDISKSISTAKKQTTESFEPKVRTSKRFLNFCLKY